MESRADPRFWREYEKLPLEIQKQARRAYVVWRQNPQHPSLHFKQVRATRPLYSVRINDDYRALGLFADGLMLWVWIGRHDVYLRQIKQRS